VQNGILQNFGIFLGCEFNDFSREKKKKINISGFIGYD
jgi:hypothetical protein